MTRTESSLKQKKPKPGPSWMGCPYCLCVGRVNKNQTRTPRVRFLFKPVFIVYRCATCNGAFVRIRPLVYAKSTIRLLMDYRALGRFLLFTSGEGPESVDRESFVVAKEGAGLGSLSGEKESPLPKGSATYDQSFPANSICKEETASAAALDHSKL